MSQTKTVLSAIQPTGEFHLGNYFGALNNWVKLQSQYDCIYGIVDCHAITMPYSPKKLRENTWKSVFNLIACGVEPENLFVQSMIPEHAELCWILNCFCSYGQLTRMTQFKDKGQQSSQLQDGFISVGLFDYPVLQAADILIYRADYVPVGKDQEQHLELSRDIANRFNSMMNTDYFVMPETLFTATPKIYSTADPSRKMSKSAGAKHNIELFAEDARIRKQIRSAVTDTGQETNGNMSAGVENLFTLMRASGAQEAHDSLMQDYKQGNLQYSKLKEEVAEALIQMVGPMRESRKNVLANKKEMRERVKASSGVIRKRAQQTLRDVKEACGLMNASKVR